MQLSVFQPASVRDLDEVSGIIASVNSIPGARYWLGQSLHAELHQFLSALGTRNPGLNTGVAVSLAPLRHPFEAALQARSVAMFTHGVHVAGFGAGSRRFQAGMLGAPYSSPLTAMQEYLDIVRDLLSGGVVEVEGEAYRVSGGLAPVETPWRVEVGAGVLRTGMARVAGRTCDVATTWLTPPGYIAERLIPAMDSGASERDRVRPRVMSVVHVVVAHEDRDPLHQAITASRMHLSMPHYRAMLEDSGIDLGEDLVHSAAALIRDGVYCYGTPDEIVEQLAAWDRAGVDEVAINLAPAEFTAGPEAAHADLRAVLEAWSRSHG